LPCSATALFAFPFKSEVQPSEILHFDFGKPILGFSVAENQRAVVYLDGEWTDPEAATLPQDKVRHVRVVGISSGQVNGLSHFLYYLLTCVHSHEVYRMHGI
jgi:hypothetical protein